jgi:2-dehydro-3-deoxy-D-arabinonate dehydratase
MQNMMMFRTARGAILQRGAELFEVNREWRELVNDDDLYAFANAHCDRSRSDASLAEIVRQPLKPVVDQELWASGVTYTRSRTARIEESKDSGGGDFYDRVYAAERPEIFFKATAQRVVGTGEDMHLRSDSAWIVPEPELVLLVNRHAKIIGYTIGNDLSCRDIEGENPLYLPQAKTFNRCAALGPGILVTDREPAPQTRIGLVIRRQNHAIVEDSTTLEQMKRTLEELVHFLFLDNAHPQGCLLMTGTGIVPDSDVSLQAGDEVEISIDGIGTLVNRMA